MGADKQFQRGGGEAIDGTAKVRIR